MQFLKKWDKMGKELSDLYPKETRSYFSGPKSLCKISLESNQNCGRRSVYRPTDMQNERMTDRRK